MPKAESAFSRNAEIHDTTIGWRFVNPLMKAQYGVNSMPETGENVAEDFHVSAPTRTRSRCAARTRRSRRRPTGGWRGRSSPVTIPQRKGEPLIVGGRASARRHHRRGSGETADAVRGGRHRDRGNASGVNDGAAALIVASEAAARERLG